MMIRAWRIVKVKHIATAFTGNGAKARPGRWNSRGVAMVYVASNVSLAILEVLANLDSQELLDHYVLYEVTFEDALLIKVDPAALPNTWRKPSVKHAKVQNIGDNWIKATASAVLGVPSAISPTEWNYLLNPNHPDFAKIIVGPKQPFEFDPRWIKTPAP